MLSATHKERIPWRAIIQVLSVFFHRQGWKLWLGIVMASVTTVFGLALLGVSGWFITATYLAGFDHLVASTFNVVMPSSMIRFLALGRTVARYAERLVTHDGTLNVLAELREQLFRGWSRPQAAKSLLQRPAQLLFRLTSDIDALDSLYLRVVVPFAAALITVVLAGMAYGALISPLLGVGLVIWLFLLGIGVPLLIALRSQRASRRKAYAAEALRARVIDMSAGQVELVMAGQMSRQMQLVTKADTYLRQADDNVNRLEVMTVLVHGVASSVGLAGVLLVCAAMNVSAALGAPMAAFALLVFLAIFEPFTALRRGAVEFGRTLLSIRRLAPRLDVGTAEKVHTSIEGDEQKTQASDLVLKQEHVLEVSDVVYAYPQKQNVVLDHVNLQIRPGERIALVGSSGSGKSTLLALISGELQPQQGQIKCSGYSILTQRTELFKDTFRGNLLLANANASDEELLQALKDAGLLAYIQTLPHGLDTWLGEGGQGLSGGQARRLALARLLLRNALLWLLDEPTEGLDQQTAMDVLKSISQKNQRKAMLIATHIQREAQIADKIICFDQGKIVSIFQKGEQGFQSALDQLNSK